MLIKTYRDMQTYTQTDRHRQAARKRQIKKIGQTDRQFKFFYLYHNADRQIDRQKYTHTCKQLSSLLLLI